MYCPKQPDLPRQMKTQRGFFFNVSYTWYKSLARRGEVAAWRRRAAILSEVSQRNLQIVKAAGISSLYLSSHYYAKCLLLSLIQGYINVQGMPKR